MSEEIQENTAKVEEDDPYAYLNRDEFSSEKFKIEVKNLPKFYGIPQLRKLINETLNLNSSKLKTPRKNCPYAFVCFRNDEDREKALVALKDYKWKGKILFAIKAKPAPDPLVKKRKNENDGNETEKKKHKQDDRTVEEKLKDSTTPWWNVSYEEQLVKKQNEIKVILRKIANDLGHQNRGLQSWIEERKKKYGGLPCELLEIRSANKREGYRNKCEFTVGINEETGLKTVGFRIGTYANGITGVGPIDSLRHIPETMKIAAKVFEKFVRASDLEVFNPEIQSGHFRQLMVRTTNDNQLMLVVGISPKDLDGERVEKLKQELIDFFYAGEGKEAKVSSLYYQPLLKRISQDDKSSKPIHLHGETHITETILGLKFRISPEAFFQVNTEAAEVLYKTAIELAEPTSKSTVVDICCGTGTIGLCFAKECEEVLGVEVVPEAIEDAELNAKTNNVENAKFFTGKAEDILYPTFLRANSEDVIAVVDPPRAGLHNKAVTTLRRIKNLKKLVYIACNPKQAMKNFTDFGRAESKTMRGEALVPVKAVAVDLFPDTPHCELVILFQRIGELMKDNSEESDKLVTDTKDEIKEKDGSTNAGVLQSDVADIQ